MDSSSHVSLNKPLAQHSPSQNIFLTSLFANSGSPEELTASRTPPCEDTQQEHHVLQRQMKFLYHFPLHLFFDASFLTCFRWRKNTLKISAGRDTSYFLKSKSSSVTLYVTSQKTQPNHAETLSTGYFNCMDEHFDISQLSVEICGFGAQYTKWASRIFIWPCASTNTFLYPLKTTCRKRTAQHKQVISPSWCRYKSGIENETSLSYRNFPTLPF